MSSKGQFHLYHTAAIFIWCHAADDEELKYECFCTAVSQIVSLMKAGSLSTGTVLVVCSE